jgi:hypothetical protein
MTVMKLKSSGDMANKRICMWAEIKRQMHNACNAVCPQIGAEINDNTAPVA